MGPLKRVYVEVSYVFMGMVLFFFFLNVVLGIAYWIRDIKVNPIRKFNYTAFGERPIAEIQKVLTDYEAFLKQGQVFAPYLQQSNTLFKSEHVNVFNDSVGFPERALGERQSSPWREIPFVDVYVLGGSAVFGEWISDADSFSARLEKYLQRVGNYQVHNYAVPGYSWEQSLILLEQMVEKGRSPSWVLFLDSAPNAQNQLDALKPRNTDVLRSNWEAEILNRAGVLYPTTLPVFRFLNQLSRFRRDGLVAKAIAERYFQPGVRDPLSDARSKFESYSTVLRQRDSIVKAIGAKSLSYWLPTPQVDCLTEGKSTDNIDPTMVALTGLVKTDVRGTFTPLWKLCDAPEPRTIDDFSFSPELYDRAARIVASDIHNLPKDEAQTL